MPQIVMIQVLVLCILLSSTQQQYQDLIATQQRYQDLSTQNYHFIIIQSTGPGLFFLQSVGPGHQWSGCGGWSCWMDGDIPRQRGRHVPSVVPQWPAAQTRVGQAGWPVDGTVQTAGRGNLCYTWLIIITIMQLDCKIGQIEREVWGSIARLLLIVKTICKFLILHCLKSPNITFIFNIPHLPLS